MELRTYLSILWRRRWIVLVTAVITTAIAAIFTFTTTPVYVSATTLRVATIGSGVIEYGRPDIGYTERLINTYAQIITSGSVRSDIMQQLNLSEPPVIKVELIPDTELIKVKAEATDPTTARQVADAAAFLLIEQSRQLYSGNGQTTQEILRQQIQQIEGELNTARQEYERLLIEDPDNSVAITAASQSIALKERTYATLLEQYENARVGEALRANTVSVVEPAYTPRQPARPRYDLNLAMGILGGLVGGIGLAFLFENLDTRLYTTQEIEETTRLSTLGKIPDAENGKLQIVHLGNGFQPHLEAFRRLRTNILSPEQQQSPYTLLVTSAERGEGKSTIVANLAVIIAQSGRRVAVVDCDMRLPTMHKIFDLPNDLGLTSALAEGVSLVDVIQETAFPRVAVIPSGPLPPNPTELLGSARMWELLAELKESYDVVLLDTPALLSVTDAAVLAPQVDHVILVVARTRSRREAVVAVRDQLLNVNVRSIGVVVNRAEQNGVRAY